MSKILPIKISINLILLPDQDISKDELSKSIKELFNKLELHVVSCNIHKSNNMIIKEDKNE